MEYSESILAQSVSLLEEKMKFKENQLNIFNRELQITLAHIQIVTKWISSQFGVEMINKESIPYKSLPQNWLKEVDRISSSLSLLSQENNDPLAQLTKSTGSNANGVTTDSNVAATPRTPITNSSVNEIQSVSNQHQKQRTYSEQRSKRNKRRKMITISNGTENSKGNDESVLGLSSQLESEDEHGSDPEIIEIIPIQPTYSHSNNQRDNLDFHNGSIPQAMENSTLLKLLNQDIVPETMVVNQNQESTNSNGDNFPVSATTSQLRHCLSSKRSNHSETGSQIQNKSTTNTTITNPPSLGQNKKCEVCGEIVAILDFQSHVQYAHPDARFWKCNFCSSAFKLKGQLSRHLLTHNKTSTIMYCRYCTWSFYKEEDLNRHEKKHEESEKFPCSYPDCKLTFYMKQKLDEHYKTHCNSIVGGEFHCTVCEKSFSRKALLGIHMKNSHPNPNANVFNDALFTDESHESIIIQDVFSQDNASSLSSSHSLLVQQLTSSTVQSIDTNEVINCDTNESSDTIKVEYEFEIID